jgi:ABC-2 type transport system ATP-binding protein
MEVLQTEQLVKQFGNIKALDDVSFSLSSGKIYALVGNNGSGKTTLFRAVMGLIFPTQGSISLFGSITERDNELARTRVGAIIENPILYENLSGYQNLEYTRILKGITDKNATDEALQKFDLTEKKRISVRHYSMGMKQRLALACALLGKPELLLLDEPLNGLDPSGIREINTILTNDCEKNGTTIFISSHYLKQLYGFATDYIFIDKGRIIGTVTAGELESKCDKCVYLSIKENEREIALRILSRILENEIRLLDNGEICIYGFQDSMTTVETSLNKERISISQVRTSGIGLEDYFLQMVGGEHHA